MKPIRLPDLLAQRGTITQAQRDEVLDLEEKTGLRPVFILLERGFLTEARLAAALEETLNLEDAGLSARPIPPEMAQVIPRAMAEHYAMVPLQATWTEVRLAMADPLDQAAMEAAQTAAQRRIVPLTTALSAVERALAALYGPRKVSHVQKVQGLFP